MGVLAGEAIAELIDERAIILNGVLGESQLQPASLDLTLGPRAWRVRASFLPPPGRTVKNRLDDGLVMHEIDLSAEGAVLERGCVYLVELNERLTLPVGISGAANPKSSTGRIDVFVRLVTDRASGGGVFDEIPAGYAGPLYAEICPRTFSILVREGSSLNQLRLKNGPAQLDDGALTALNEVASLINAPADIDGGIGLRVDLRRTNGRAIGWRARRHAALIDIDQRGDLDGEDYFEAIESPKSGFIILDPDEFYILASKESLVIPPDFAAEMTPISPGLGEFRVHYAGFFDPGFGWSGENADNSNDSRAVLEVRCHDAPFVLEDGQLVARLVYERMAARPARLYGEGDLSNYQGQGLKLSKHFR